MGLAWISELGRAEVQMNPFPLVSHKFLASSLPLDSLSIACLMFQFCWDGLVC